jgi:hypothetical protein
MRRFRKVCRTLHRELGYVAVGLTLVYAISGIAVNHAHHWDANYSRTVTHRRIEPVGTGPTAEIAPRVLAQLPDDRPLKNTWRAREDLLQVFLEGGGFDVNLVTGEVVDHGFAKRPLVYDLNFMHLNSGKAPWTGIADAYAGVLCVLALTGIWLVKGRKGLAGRGGIMMGLGILLPVVYAVVMRAQG